MTTPRSKHVLLIFILTACTVGFYNASRLVLRDVKHSVYYRPNLRKAHHTEYLRRAFAEGFIAEKRRNGFSFATNSHVDKSKMCVVIIVAPRQVSYLLESAASVLRGLDEDSEFFIYTSQPWGTMESGPVKSDLAQLVELGVEVVDASAVNSSHASRCASFLNCRGKRKESSDYANALRLCTNRVANGYVVIMEDDGYATQNFAWKLRESVRRIHDRTRSPGSGDWLLLKLFVTSFWSGWMKKAVDISILVLWGFALSSCIVCCLRFSICKDPSAPRTQLLIVGIYVWVWSSVGIFLVNKQNTPFNPWYFRGLYKMEPDNVASTVGHLYPHSQAVELSKFIAHQVNGDKPGVYAKLPVDILIGTFARLRKLDCFVTVPTLVEHLGVVSSLPWKSRARKDLSEQILYSSYKSSTWFVDDLPGTS